MFKYNTKNTVKNLCCILFACVSIKAVAQQNNYSPNIAPPSPIAFELGKYGNVPVGLFTGSPNFNIPLYTYKTTNLEVPITMFYANNGIKVDEISSNVGQGWNLNFGGVITRIVRDQPDEKRSNNLVPLPSDANANDTALFFRSIALYDNTDSEADLYCFNFGNYSGKFVFDNEKNIMLMPAQNLVVKKRSEDNSFLVITPDGVKYYFADTEVTSLPKELNGRPLPIHTVTAWYLSKIVHPKGDEIYFHYTENYVEYSTSQSQSLHMLWPTIQSGCPQINGPSDIEHDSSPTITEIDTHSMEVYGKAIQSISSNNSNSGIITFNYLSNASQDVDFGNNKINSIVVTVNNLTIEDLKFGYTCTENNRVFLDKISSKDLSKNYLFEYLEKEKFPSRLSLSQDHWGYYNGAYNTKLVTGKTGIDYGAGLNLDNINYSGANKEPNADFAKIGMLTNIIYPTKGNTVLEYESNDYYGLKTTKPVLKTNTLTVNKNSSLDEDGRLFKTVVYTSLVDEWVSCEGSVWYDGVCAGNPDDAGKTISQFTVIDNINNSNQGIYRLLDNGDYFFLDNSVMMQTNTNYAYCFRAYAGKSYTLHLSVYNSAKPIFRLCSGASIRFTYTESPAVSSYQNILTGGVRIKSTKDYSVNNANPFYKRYFYAPKIDLTKSSGDKGKTPDYIDYTKNIKVCVSQDGYEGHDTFTPLTYVNVFSSSLVALFDTGNSNVFYKYVTVSNGDDAFANGGEEHEFLIQRDAIGNVICGNKPIESTPLSNGGWKNGLLKKISYFNNGGTTIKTSENFYEENISQRKESVSYSTRKYFDMSTDSAYQTSNLGVMSYKNISFWHYLKSTEEKQYDLDGLNPVVTNTTFSYNNPVHLQLSSQTTKSSGNETMGNETIENKYFYPQDLEMANEPFKDDLVTQRMVGFPLVTQTFRNSVKLSEQRTEFTKNEGRDGLLLPKFIYAAKFPNTFTSPNQLERKITYDKYDDKGNILQYTLENKMPVSIIWGNEQTKPIAKVENASYNQAIAAYSTNNKIFRDNLPNAMVTTYTYDSLIRLTSVTDPKNLTTYYEYDDNNRLRYIKDQNSNILQSYCYNYKGHVIDCSSLISTPEIIYNSIAKSGSFTRNNCDVGGLAPTVVYTVPEGKYTSISSQSAADLLAEEELNTKGQAYANSKDCTYSSIAKSGTYTKNNCGTGESGASVKYAVAAGKFSSIISQQDANRLAQDDLDINGQNYANSDVACYSYDYEYLSQIINFTIKSTSPNHGKVSFQFKIIYTDLSETLLETSKRIVFPAGVTSVDFEVPLEAHRIREVQLNSISPTLY